MILHGPLFLLQVCMWVLVHFKCLATHHLYCCIHWNSSNVTQCGVIFVFLVVWTWLRFKVCSLSLSTYSLEWRKLFKIYCFSKIVHHWSDYNKRQDMESKSVLLFMCNAKLISMGLQMEEDGIATKVELPQKAQWMLMLGDLRAKR